MFVKTSGLTKEDYMIKRLLSEEIMVRPNCWVQKYLAQYLSDLTAELKWWE